MKERIIDTTGTEQSRPDHASSEQVRPDQVSADQVSSEQQHREEALIEEVIASFDDTENPRLKFVMQSLVKHLHAFIREVRLTEEERNTAIAFLTDSGHITTETRQEFVLLSDVFGASMQVVAINNEAYEDATEATVFGPSSWTVPPRSRSAATCRSGRQVSPAT